MLCFSNLGDTNRSVDLAAVVVGRAANPPRMVKLCDNFRMNSALSAFTSRLYGSDYIPSSSSRNRGGKWGLLPGAAAAGRPLSVVLPALLSERATTLPEIIAVKLVPNAASSDVAASSALQQLAAESTYVADLVEALAATHSSSLGAVHTADSVASNIFICAPHNAQKSAIKGTLTERGHAAWADHVDTVDRMQGQERDVVIICLAVFTEEAVTKEVDFLFSKQRLNVAISRAKKSCILVYTDSLVALNPAVIGDVQANEAYEHVLAFVSAAEGAQAAVQVSVTL